MIYVRHLSAAGAGPEWWTYDAVRKVVTVTVRSCLFAVDVCSTTAPRFGAFPIVRVDGCTWRIPPARFTSRIASGELVTHSCALHEVVGTDALTLLDASDAVAAELSGLG